MPRAGRVSDSQATRWLDDAKRATHLGLSVQDPFSVADPASVEVAGGTYSRQPVLWTRSGRLNRNTDAVTFTGIPAGTVIVFIVGWSAPTGGEMVFAFPFSLTLTAGGGFSLAASSIFFGLDA